MEELISLVTKKTGLDKKQAEVVVDLVLDYLKKKLPAPIGGQIDAFLGGKSQLSDAADMLGGLFGDKK